jgi:signal transduction histidine kinase
MSINLPPFMQSISPLDNRNEFLSIASHELKTPLTALKLQIEMAKKVIDREGAESLQPQKIKKIIERTHQDILRITRLVDDMLDVSRIENEKFNIHLEYFHLEEFIEAFLDRISTLKHFHLIEVNINAPVMVRWDRFRIEQVILNLITNAIRYGNSSPIKLTISSGGGFAYIEVKDEGRGISLDRQKKIFERFERGSEDKAVDGLGLGLYISREIMKHHHGEILLESALGKGSTFLLKLPVKVED